MVGLAGWRGSGVAVCLVLCSSLGFTGLVSCHFPSQWSVLRPAAAGTQSVSQSVSNCSPSLSPVLLITRPSPDHHETELDITPLASPPPHRLLPDLLVKPRPPLLPGQQAECGGFSCETSGSQLWPVLVYCYPFQESFLSDDMVTSASDSLSQTDNSYDLADFKSPDPESRVEPYRRRKK